MKFYFLFLLLLLLPLAPLPAQDNGIPQTSDLLVVPAGDKFLRWHGHAGRSYFIQVSDASNPLVKWLWAPIIESGNDEEISYEVDGTPAKGFFRLKYTDQLPGPNETLETADFDDDNISNIDEIDPPAPLEPADATDPLDADTDGDGMNDGWERIHGLNPNNNGSLDPDNGPTGDLDGDGLSNAGEFASGSDPNDFDTDGDGLQDGDEYASSPGTDSTNPDSDGDGLLDGEDADPTEVLVSWAKTPDSSYMLIEIQAPLAEEEACDINDKGEVLFSNGLWSGGTWTSLQAPDLEGAYQPDPDDPYETTFTSSFTGWRYFDSSRNLLGNAEILLTSGQSAYAYGFGSSATWLSGQSPRDLGVDAPLGNYDSKQMRLAELGITKAKDAVTILHSNDYSGFKSVVAVYPAHGGEPTLLEAPGDAYILDPSTVDSCVTPNGWIAARAYTDTGDPGHKIILWNPVLAEIALPAAAVSYSTTINLTDLPAGRLGLAASNSIGANSQVFLPDPQGAMQHVESLSSKNIITFAGDGTAITRDHKLWRNGKLIPLRDLSTHYGELLDAGWNLSALKSNKHGVYLIVGQDENGAVKNLLLQPARFELRNVADVAKGWDNTGTQPWTSVGVGKTKSIVKLVIPGCTQELGALFELIPKPGDETRLSLANQTITGETTEFDITGAAATPEAGAKIIVREKADHANTSQPLNVHVLPPKTVKFNLFYASDHRVATSALPAGLKTAQEIKDELNAAYEDQSNVNFTPNGAWTVNDCYGAFSADGPLRFNGAVVPPQQYMYTACERRQRPQMDLQIYLIKKLFLDRAIGVNEANKCTVNVDANIQTIAHEAGHAMKLATQNYKNYHDKGPWPKASAGKPGLLGLNANGRTRWIRQQDWYRSNSYAHRLEDQFPKDPVTP